VRRAPRNYAGIGVASGVRAWLIATLALAVVGCGGGGDGAVPVPTNRAPNAMAGADQSVTVGVQVTLNGSSSSDPDGDALTYSWSFSSRPTGSAASLEGATAATPRFTPDVGGIYTLTLTVDDGILEDADTVTVDVNTIPVADAGPDRDVSIGAPVSLDGSNSNDADGDQLTYAWSLQAPLGSSATLSNAAAVSPTFTPDIEGDYAATLIVEDSRDQSQPAAVTIFATSRTMVVTGTVTFDKVGHAANGGLDYTNVVAAPARGVLIEVVDDDQRVVSTTITDDQGRYDFELRLDLQVRLRAKAWMQRSGTPFWSFPVIDNTRDGALYSIESPSFRTGVDDLVVDLHAPSGWNDDVGRYTSTRSAAPFAILDAIYNAVDQIIGEQPSTIFPPMDVNWSRLNRPSVEFEPEIGAIVTTAYNFDVGIQALYVLGSPDEDTDEYDPHVLVHELAHYLEDRLGRTDSAGGSHSTTSRLDPRLAFSEGWANAFSAIVLGDPIYKDSMGAEQAGGFTFDVEANSASNEGWYNESSVHSVLYDIYDQAADGLDATAAGFGPLWEGITGWHADTEALTSLFSLIPELKNRLPADATNIDALLSDQSIVGPTMDIWASTETNDAGRASDVLPVYTGVTVDDATPVQVCTIDQFGSFNRLSNRRFVTFDVAASDQYRITVTGPAGSDPDLFLYKRGFLNSSEGFVEAQEVLTQALSLGRHVLEVYDACIVFGPASNPSTCPGNVPSRICLGVKVEKL
jgi:hypothetical protein